MTNEEKEAWLSERGWSTWYNPKYWVHSDCVEDPSSMDYTNYGFNIDDAIAYEKLGRPKFKFHQLPQMSKIEMAIRTKGLKENE